MSGLVTGQGDPKAISQSRCVPVEMVNTSSHDEEEPFVHNMDTDTRFTDKQ
jgi:hypothetical protein